MEPGALPWKWTLIAAIAAVIAFSPMVFWDPGFGFLTSFFVFLPIVCLAFLIQAIRKKKAVTFLLPVAAYFAVSLTLLFNTDAVRDWSRWVLVGHRYRAAVKAQALMPGELKHVEWDGWGFAGGGDTVVYLVFDPTDSLRAAPNRQRETVSILPCPVAHIRRFSSGWYAVQFYTDTEWDHCEVLGKD